MNKAGEWLWIVLMILLLSQFATAVGIRPAKTYLQFEKTPDYKGTVWVINSDHQSFTTTVGVQGELASYVTISTTELRFREDEDALPIDFEIHLPKEMPPGESTANIVVEQTLDDSAAGVISSKIVLKHKIVVQGPYPEKYVKAKVNFFESGEEVRFVSEVENLGSKEISQVKTTFYVNDKEQQKQALETMTTALQPNENKLLDARISKKVFDQGEFEVLALTKYDDQQVEVVKKLRVGKPEVDIMYFDPYFIAQKINSYSMDLLNKWNLPVEQIYVDVNVNKDGQTIDKFRTKSVDIDALTSKRISDYFDARNKNPGKYTFDMIVHFWGTYQMESKLFQSELLPAQDANKLEELRANPTGKAVETSPTANSFSWSMLGWVFAALLAIGAGYILWRYLHKDEYEE